ncbi:MAG: hypothetical protein ACRD08_06240, partial [Acidimicrobiales bacterium]
VYRVSQVGTRETPLVGPYSFHGFAHPGPLLYWLAAPLYRLTSGDPRSLLWTAAALNVVVIAALASVAWRRGRWPLLLGTMVLVALLVHGFGPAVMVDLWNPYVALLPFLLAVFLAWDAALGRPRALVEAVLPASLAVQSHLAFLSLTALVALWLLGWARWSPRVVPRPSDAGTTTVRLPPLRGMILLAGALWIGPLLDAVFDLHNPIKIARALARAEHAVGAIDAIPLVARHVRLDGLWVTGMEPWVYPPMDGLNALPFVVLLVLLVGCFCMARRRRLVDVAALATLALTLLIGSIPVAGQLMTPPASYLTEWLKIVGGLAWFMVAWTGWRLVEATVRARGSRNVLCALAGVTLVVGTAWSWREAMTTRPPLGTTAVVGEVRSGLGRVLARDKGYRVEVVGDTNVFFAGLIYWMIHDGFDVVTSDGAPGLKWGHAHRWMPGDDYDAFLTVSVHLPGSSLADDDDCDRGVSARRVFNYDGLAPQERAWLEALAWQALADANSITPDDHQRAAELGKRDLRIAVYEGSRLCQQEEVR